MVLPAYTPALQGGDKSREQLISEYFRQGYTNNEIIVTLMSVHSLSLSLASLKRVLRHRGLRRRPTLGLHAPLYTIIGAILEITEHSGQCLGYRTVWKRLCSQYNFCITRDTVMELMRVIDGQGVERRRRRRLLRRRYSSPGPNFVWHIDGCDKLKPFGFAIHGAIDGFSRRILWLEVGCSNNDPNIVATYYLETVKQLGGSPVRCRCDLGTENTILEEIQTFLTVYNDQNSTDDCFLYGKSTSNQRIESWWSILRRQASDWWITFFENLRNDGLIRDHDELCMQILRFCFMNVIRNELKHIAILWNQHTIQMKKDNDGLRGKPDVMFFTPQMYDTFDFKIPCDNDCVDQCTEMYGSERQQDGISQECHELIQILLSTEEAQPPVNVNDAVSLYARLLGEIDRLDN